MSIHIKNVAPGDKVVFRDGSVGVVQSLMSEIKDGLPPHGERIEARFNIKRSYGSSYHTYRRDGICHHEREGDIVAILPASTSADENHKFSGIFMAALMGGVVKQDQDRKFYEDTAPMGDPYILRSLMEEKKVEPLDLSKFEFKPPRFGLHLADAVESIKKMKIDPEKLRQINDSMSKFKRPQPKTQISVSEYKSLMMDKVHVPRFLKRNNDGMTRLEAEIYNAKVEGNNSLLTYLTTGDRILQIVPDYMKRSLNS